MYHLHNQVQAKIKPAKQKFKSNIIMKVMAIYIINCPICL